MSDRGKWLLLGGLVAVWVVLVVMRLLTAPEPRHVALTFKSGHVARPDRTADLTGLPKVVRPKQTKPAEPPAARPINIFAPLGVEREADKPKVAGARGRGRTASPGPQASATGEMFGPEPPPPPVTLPSVPSLSPEELAAQQARQQKELAAQQARQRLGQYRFLGYLTEGGEQRAFLGKGKELYIVRTGETVEGKIRVIGIDASSVQLTDADTGVGTTLPLVKEGGGPS
jgi:hypothetical protein